MKTILIVDDVAENLHLLTAVLEPHYRVRAASSGARALTIAQGASPPDLVLLDVMMPELDGYAVLAQLKAQPATASIPVIFVTALDSPVDEERGLALGAVDYVTKPVRAAILLARVRTHLELKAAHDWHKDRARALEAEVSSRLEEVLAVQDVTIRALGRLAEIRDPETGNHLRRTQGYMRTLAEALRHHPRFAHDLTPKNIEALVKSAPLHDIGKVGIPDRILLKPAKLTPDEWTIMKTHAQLGADAIARAEEEIGQPVEFLRFAKEIAGCHHEKWDGSGYPRGLAGDDIPVAARLMALADVFDALTSRRVYKPAFSFERAAEILLEGRGMHFDPDVVDTYVAERETFERIALRYVDTDAELLSKEHARETALGLVAGQADVVPLTAPSLGPASIGAAPMGPASMGPASNEAPPRRVVGRSSTPP